MLYMHVKKQKKETRARATLPEKLPPASDASNPGMLEQGKTTFEPQQPALQPTAACTKVSTQLVNFLVCMARAALPASQGSSEAQSWV